MYEKKIEGFRLSTQQKHLWALQQSDSSFPYRTQCAVIIEGILNIETLKSALDTVVNRYEILRTIFKSLPGEIIPLQVITDNSLPPIHQKDLRALTPSEQAMEIEAIWQNLSMSPCGLEKATTLYVSLIILSPHKHLLLLVLPSICADLTTLKNGSIPILQK